MCFCPSRVDRSPQAPSMPSPECDNAAVAQSATGWAESTRKSQAALTVTSMWVVVTVLYALFNFVSAATTACVTKTAQGSQGIPCA